MLRSGLEETEGQLQSKGIPAQQPTFGALALLFSKSYFVLPLTESSEGFRALQRRPYLRGILSVYSSLCSVSEATREEKRR